MTFDMEAYKKRLEEQAQKMRAIAKYTELRVLTPEYMALTLEQKRQKFEALAMQLRYMKKEHTRLLAAMSASMNPELLNEHTRFTYVETVERTVDIAQTEQKFKEEEQALSCEQRYYSPTICISYLDLLQLLPTMIEINVTWHQVTHVTLHSRKRWGTGEYVAFHEKGENPKRDPFERIPNQKSALAHTFINVSRADGEKLGYVYQFPFDMMEISAHENDNGPAIERAKIRILC